MIFSQQQLSTASKRTANKPVATAATCTAKCQFRGVSPSTATCTNTDSCNISPGCSYHSTESRYKILVTEGCSVWLLLENGERNNSGSSLTTPTDKNSTERFSMDSGMSIHL